MKKFPLNPVPHPGPTPRLLWEMIAVYVVVLFAACTARFYSFGYYDFDLAVHDQVMWNLLRGDAHSSILGFNFLGNHLHLIVFFLLPVYALLPHPLTLLFLKTLALGLGAWPLFALARKVLNDSWALVLVLVYFFYPSLIYVNLFEYHPSVFAAPLLLAMFYFYHERRFGPFNICLLLALLVQENVPLVIMATGVYGLLLRRDTRWSWYPLLIGIAYFVLAVKFLLPHFSQGMIQFDRLYQEFGTTLPEVFVNMITHPGAVFGKLTSPDRLLYLAKIFVPLGLIPFANPLALLPALPLFLQHMLSAREADVMIQYHYLAEMIPVIFMAMVFGLRRVVRYLPAGRAGYLQGALIVLIMASAVVLGSFAKVFEYGRPNDVVRDVRRQLSLIPDDAPVVATCAFLPHLTHRPQLYAFHHVYMNTPTLSDRAYRLPPEVRHAIIDFDDAMAFYGGFYEPQRYANLQAFLKDGRWSPVSAEGNIVVFRRGIPKENEGERLAGLFARLPEAPEPQHRVDQIVADGVEFYGYDVGGVEPRYLDLTMYWRSLDGPAPDMLAFLQFRKNGRLVHVVPMPVGYRVYPSQSWPAQSWFRENRRLLTPPECRDGDCDLWIGFHEFRARELRAYLETDPAEGGMIELGHALKEAP